MRRLTLTGAAVRVYDRGRTVFRSGRGRPMLGAMTWEYLHLIVHQFPIVLAVAGAAMGLGGWAAGRTELERYGVLSVLLAGVAAVPSYYTGLAAADTAVRRTFVQPGVVEHHRTWATWAAVLLVSAGAFAGFSLWQPEDGRLRRFVLLAGLAAAGLTGYAAWLGGQIVHGSAPEPGPAAVDSVAAARAAPPSSGAAATPRALAWAGDRAAPRTSVRTLNDRPIPNFDRGETDAVRH